MQDGIVVTYSKEKGREWYEGTPRGSILHAILILFLKNRFETNEEELKFHMADWWVCGILLCYSDSSLIALYSTCILLLTLLMSVLFHVCSVGIYIPYTT